MGFELAHVVKPYYPFTRGADGLQGNSLQAWYLPSSLPKGGQTVLDSSGNGYHAQLTARPSPAGTYGWRDGIMFNGQYALDAGTVIPFDGDNFTILQDYMLLPGWASASCRHVAYYTPTLWTSPLISGQVGVIHGGSVDVTFTPAIALADFQRNVFIVTRTGNTLKVFQNGIRILNNTSFSVTFLKTGNVYIARGNDFIEETPCEVYETRFYNRGISDAEAITLSSLITRYEMTFPVGLLQPGANISTSTPRADFYSMMAGGF